MSRLRKVKKILRGNVSLKTVALEAFRLQKTKLRRRGERGAIERINDAPARLRNEFAGLSEQDLLTYFRRRRNPLFFFSPDLEELSGSVQATFDAFFPSETERLLQSAGRIVDEKRWALLGFGEMDFKAEENAWRRDPLGKIDWGLDYHGDLKYTKQPAGADVRVLWELNRFGHALTLAQSYLLTKDESCAEEFFSQIKSWQDQNPYARGANWSCAMEVALRLINLLAAFEIFKRSPALNAARLAEMLRLFDQHGRYISRNSEFSYVSTSNHYLSNVIGLLWLGVLLPELQQAAGWRRYGLGEMLREMDKQVLPDGADYESSTGYHRLVTELFLYSFLLCRRNGIEIPGKYREKLRLMLGYIRGYLRPDGLAPLVGDTDGGQTLPFVKREADDHAYLLALGAVFFDEADFKISDELFPEVLWNFGVAGLEKYRKLKIGAPRKSQAFPEAGAYIMRKEDLYLHFNASDCGLGGRGSHGHNDALSVEISAFGVPFVVDPGSYVYSFDLGARQLFRSTAYHSTAQLGDSEQNSIDADVPFVVGNEARPRVLKWESDGKRDLLVAEHYGYTRSSAPVIHRRTIEFHKNERFWSIEDAFCGEGARRRRIHFRFHLAPELKVEPDGEGAASVVDSTGNKLFIKPFGLNAPSSPEIDQVWVSRNYGERRKSSSLRWTLDLLLPVRVRFAVVPLAANEDEIIVSEKLESFWEVGRSSSSPPSTVKCAE